MNRQEEINKIDMKLSVLFENMEYEDYVNFIKSNDVLKSFDFVLGRIDINKLPKAFEIMITNDVINEVNKIIDDKINELNLQQ